MMSIKEMPELERPQEKLLYSGVGSLSTAELIALVIRTGTSSKSAVQLAEDVLSYSNREIGPLPDADVRELTQLDGIGVSKACSIVASLELARRYSAGNEMLPRDSMRNPDAVANVLMEELRGLKQEHLIAILVNAKCEVESKVTVSIGELTFTSIHPRDVFRPAIRKGAAGIILAHNHPSGDPTPSREDIESTRRLVEVAKVMGIKILDHIILGEGKYISLKTEGYMG